MIRPNSSSRVPLSDPSYRYPASRNPYWAKLQGLRGGVYSDNGTESRRGEWRAAFPDAPTAGGPHPEGSGGRRELYVEIGCNAGHVTVEWAARDPKAAYIGIDWKYKPIFRAAEKAQKRGLGNALFFRAHAERLPFMFGPGEVDRLYLFFPDPWPKKSQWKNRFVTAETLALIAPVLREGGVFHIRTDHPGYFEWMEAAAAEARGHWEAIERSRDLHADHPDPRTLEIPEVTLFERLFIRDGIPINSLKLRRRTGPNAGEIRNGGTGQGQEG